MPALWRWMEKATCSIAVWPTRWPLRLVPPQLGWRSIAAFSLNSDGKNLYVLDPAGNAVWQYTGSLGQFPDLPVMFFGEQVPQNMNTAIDLAANDSDLYMLFQDGHVTTCPLTALRCRLRCVAPIRPPSWIGVRNGSPAPKINDAIFTQMTFASAPDPSPVHARTADAGNLSLQPQARFAGTARPVPGQHGSRTTHYSTARLRP